MEAETEKAGECPASITCSWQCCWIQLHLYFPLIIMNMIHLCQLAQVAQECRR